MQQQMHKQCKHHNTVTECKYSVNKTVINNAEVGSYCVDNNRLRET